MLETLPPNVLCIIISELGSIPRLPHHLFTTDRKDFFHLLLLNKQINKDISVDKDWYIYRLLFASFQKSLNYATGKATTRRVVNNNVYNFAMKKKLKGVIQYLDGMNSIDKINKMDKIDRLAIEE